MSKHDKSEQEATPEVQEAGAFFAAFASQETGEDSLEAAAELQHDNDDDEALIPDPSTAEPDEEEALPAVTQHAAPHARKGAVHEESDVRPRYRALKGISIRASTDPNDARYETFVEFKAGQLLSKAPPHTDFDFLIADGAVEEVVPRG